ncbi:hypothetical protein [Acanthopleuribacter pedis]|uniref:ACT domain-containing protein n=1 Tax=Acanthopleuribacter pedis TaxID=442870 RepID=A0A8J7QHE6_9BACT|nr:hypothetical protein [Acanthopleuribacter pedis]MBO1320240.1 hypothetical protein [Acanthopleuribacter pedis]
MQRLSQGRPGQLGSFCRFLAEAGVNIEVMYSDHDHRLILVVDDLKRARVIANQWQREEHVERPAKWPHLLAGMALRERGCSS